MIRTFTRFLILVIFEAAMVYLGSKAVAAAFGATDGGSASLFMLGACVCWIVAVGGLMTAEYSIGRSSWPTFKH